MAIRPYLSGLRREVFVRRRHLFSDLLALGLLTLATVGFFWQVLFAGAWMPAGGGDLTANLYPTYHFAARALKSGAVPLWNPYLWSGTPFAADIETGLFYPVNLVYFWLAPEVTYRGVMGLSVFHFWLAGAGMYWFLRTIIGRNRAHEMPPIRGGHTSVPLEARAILPPLLGALAFMFSDYFIVHFGNLNLIAQAAWLPFIFLFYYRSLSERRLGLAVWSGVFFAVATTAGHIQPLLFITLGIGWDVLYHLGLAFTGRRVGGDTFLDSQERKLPSARKRLSVARLLRDLHFPLGTFAITLLVGLGLATFVFLPAFEMAGYTIRADYDYSQASQYSLAPAQLVGLLVPGFFGRDPAVHWGAWDRVEVGYTGVLTLLLALFALLIRLTSPRVEGAQRQTYRFASLAVVSLLLAMGGYTLLHGWLYWLVPGFGGVRAPARFVFLTDFALAALAALGLDALIRGADDLVRPALARLLRVAPWVIGALVLFAIPLAFYAVITSQDKDPVIFARVSAAANGLVFFAGVLVVGVGLFYLRHRGGFRPSMVGALAVGLLFFDLASLGSNVDVGYDDPTRNFDHPAATRFLKSDVSLYRIDTRTDVWHVWQPDTGLLHDVFDAGGWVNPLNLADYDRYWRSIPGRSSPLYDFLNAKYVIAAKDVTLDWEKFVPVFDGDPAVNVYLNQRALPRALVVHRAVAVPDHEAAFAALHAPDFDPATMVVIEGGGALDVTPPGAATIRFDAYRLNEICLSVDTPADAYLVLSEVWYPGWHATVDGEETPVLRANYAFRALRLKPGQHQVRLAFAPRSWTLGLAVSGVTLLALVGWGVWRGAGRRVWQRRARM